MLSKPAPSRMPAVASASPSENGSAPGCGGCAASPSAAPIARAHSLSSRRCQTSSTSRASGRRAAAMLANAAAGSEKNIAPKRLIATSKAGGVDAMQLGVAQLVVAHGGVIAVEGQADVRQPRGFAALSNLQSAIELGPALLELGEGRGLRFARG